MSLFVSAMYEQSQSDFPLRVEQCIYDDTCTLIFQTPWVELFRWWNLNIFMFQC